jgi:hypothetical protein
MNNSVALRAMTLIVTSLIISLGTTTLPVCAVEAEDHTIRPGIGLGIVKLGMDRAQIKKTAGNIDGSYTLPSGIKVDYAEWKEPEPKKSPNIRYFYGATGKVIQINSAAPVPFTADGISCQSTLADVTAKYKKLKCFEYRAKDARIDYYDDMKRGIAFEFTRADGASTQKLYAIIMHLPGKRVIADADEKPLAIKAE